MKIIIAATVFLMSAGIGRADEKPCFYELTPRERAQHPHECFYKPKGPRACLPIYCISGVEILTPAEIEWERRPHRK